MYLPLLSVIAATVTAVVIPPINQRTTSMFPNPVKISNELLGNKDINISIVKREDFTADEANLFKSLFFQSQVSSFSYDQEGDLSEDCYDDRLPVNIIIHKGGTPTESDKQFVDDLREMHKEMIVDYAVIDEDAMFKYDLDTVTEEDAIRLQSLKNKVIRSSVASFLDRYNDLVYVVNGTEIDMAS